MKFTQALYSLLFSGIVTSTPAQAHKLVFERPLELTINHLPVSVEKVRDQLNKSANRWQSKVVDTFSAFCKTTIRLEGRDLALKNRRLAEHYFGSIQFDCDGRGFGSSDFSTLYSRALFMGIRNCVESETMIDGDYCRLRVLALRRETDRNNSNKDLLKTTESRIEYLRLHSPQALAWANEKQVIPEGLNLKQIDAAQVFDLSIGRTGETFFLNALENRSSIPQGPNYYLSPASDFSQREKIQEDKVIAALDKVDEMMTDIEASPNAAEDLKNEASAVFIQLSLALKETLGLMSPVNYFRNERRIRDTEESLLAIFARIDPRIKERSDWEKEYQSSLGDYATLSRYLTSRALTSIFSEDGDASIIDEGDREGQHQSSEAAHGKIFREEDREIGRDDWYSSYYELACFKALRSCNAFVRSLKEEGRFYTCVEHKKWVTSAARYCEFKVNRINVK